MVYGLLDRKSVAPKQPLDELLPELLEEATRQQRATGEPLDQAWIETLSRAIPELGEEFGREIPPGRLSIQPTQWILFTPPTTASVFNRQLMADYEDLEQRLQNGDSDVGGLRLLEDAAVSSKALEADLLPIVPLNPSQTAA
jgi:hypothetical protein